jgi:virginiamycin B lyase
MKHWLNATFALAAIAFAAPATAAPTIQEFTIPVESGDPDPNPQDLVLGTDGNIWFAERGASMIGRISASSPGTIDEFPTKNAGAAPDIMTVGPDGRIWFTELSGNSIGRIDPASPSTPDSFGGFGLQTPRGIAVGPDGNLWVTDADPANPEVLIISPAGSKVDDVALPANFDPKNITRDPDGNMWVAASIRRTSPASRRLALLRSIRPRAIPLRTMRRRWTSSPAMTETSGTRHRARRLGV